jgi:hypothetical protein
VTLRGAIGSLAPAIVASLHRSRADRVFICVAESPQAAAATQADLETLLEQDGESHL